MKFFTDKSVIHSYLIIKITDYIKINDFSNWNEVFIDPNVYELIKAKEYSWINKINITEFLNNLPKNHFLSIDYPSDMNIKHQKLFLEKSWYNALKYNNHPNYITTAQYKFNDFWNFVEWFDKYNTLEIKSGILGLGNLCKIRYLTDYLNDIIDYAISNCNHPRIHFYGLCMKGIPLAYKLAKRYNIKLSIDSVKWTKASTIQLKNNYGVNCNKLTRQIFFDTYLELIKRKIKDIA